MGNKGWTNIEAENAELAVMYYANEEFYEQIKELPDIEVKGHGKWCIYPEITYMASKL